MFSRISAETCKHSSGLSSTNKSTTSLRFSLCSCNIFLRSYFCSTLCGMKHHFFPFIFLSGCNALCLLISSGHDTADELDRHGALLKQSTVPCDHSPLVSTFFSVVSFYLNTSIPRSPQYSLLFLFFVLFAIFILHSRESELYGYTLDGKSALAWEFPFSRFMGHLSST